MGHSKREEQEPLGTAPWASRSLYKIFDSLEMGSSHALWHSLFQRWVDIHMGINAPPPTLPVALCRGAKVCSSRSEGSKWMRTRPAVTTQGFTFLYPQIPKNCRFWRLPSKLLSTHYSLVSSVQSVTFCGNWGLPRSFLAWSLLALLVSLQEGGQYVPELFNNIQ